MLVGSTEKLYFDSSSYFDDLIADIQRASVSINIEMYIWATDKINDRLFEALKSANDRGVKVRIVVDGIGSYYWILSKMRSFLTAGLQIRIFHPLPWPFCSIFKISIRAPLQFINRRNHRKIFIIDDAIVYTGSMNVMREAFAWRETGVRLNHLHVPQIQNSFRKTWFHSGHRLLRWLQNHARPYERGVPKDWLLVRSNQNFRMRRRLHADYLHRIRLAQRRIWIVTPYFVPPRNIARALKQAAIRGVDVRIVIPQTADIFFIPWVARLYYRYLLEGGIKIYEYTKGMLHAKSTLIDSWALVGSSNLNHRSLFKDLELDIVISTQSSRDQLEQQFLIDMKNSQSIDQRSPLADPGWIARMLFNLRAWL